MYRGEVTSFLANVAAASNGVFFDPQLNNSFHYLRTEAPVAPEAISSYPHRLKISRTNPYLKPGAYLDVKTFIKSFDTRQCDTGLSAALDPNSPNDPDFNVRTGGDVAKAQAFFDKLKRFAFNEQLSTDTIGSPACGKQSPYGSVGVSPEESDYLHVRELP